MMPVGWLGRWAMVLAVGAAWGAAGWTVKGAFDRAELERSRAALARAEQRWDQERAAGAAAAAARLEAAQQAERAALAGMAATHARLAQQNKRLKGMLDAIPGRDDCGLSGPARGVLNAHLDTLAGGDGDVPARAAQPDRAAAGAGADSGAGDAALPEPGRDAYGGDTPQRELGAWIADAAQRYAECRARIEAISQWDAQVGQTQEGAAHGR